MSDTVTHAEAVARHLYPHLWNGVFEATLAKISLFTPQQAAESAVKKRAEKIESVCRVLEASEEVGR